MRKAERNSILSSSSGPSEDRDGGKGGGVGLFAGDDDKELDVGVLAEEEDSSGPSEDRIGGEGGGVSSFAEDDDEELGVDALADEEAIAVIIEW